MPEVTDLMRVAQWAKSSGSPSDVYNAACRLLDVDMILTAKVNGALYRSAENDVTELIQRIAKAEATIERVKELRDWWYARPHMSDYADALDVALDGPEDHGGGRTPQTQGAVEGQEAREAQEGPRWLDNLTNASRSAYLAKHPQDRKLSDTEEDQP